MDEGQLGARARREPLEPERGGRAEQGAGAHTPRRNRTGFDRARRNRYVAAVSAAAVVGLGGPALVNAALTGQPEAQYEDSADAFENNLATYADWPLDFGALADCTAPITEDAMGVPEFTCPTAKVEVIGMVNVKDQPLAVDRAIRAINFADLQSMRPATYTKTALKIAPGLVERAGVTEVWASDYYEVAAEPGQNPGADPFKDVDLSRTVGFYRPDDGAGDGAEEGEEDKEGDAPGSMVVLQVTARGVDNTKAMVNELLRTAELRPAAEDAGTPQQREGGR